MKKRRVRMKAKLGEIIAYDGDKTELYREIGRFVFEYSQLEAELRRVFRRKVGIDPKHGHIMAAGFDFAKLVSAIKAASALEEKDGKPDPALETLLNACHDVNTQRIVVVHGRWSSSYGGDQAYHISRGSMQQQKYFEYEGELDAASDAIVKLRQNIVTAVNKGDERRKPSQ